MNTILYFQAPAKSTAPEKLAGVREVAAPAGMHVQVVEEPPDARRMADLSEFWRPLGAIVDCGSLGGVDTAAFSAVPTVYLSGDPGALPQDAAHVRHDSAATARLAARELLETGFESFAFVPNRTPRHWSDVRGRAFEEAIRLNGRPCRAMERPAGAAMSGDAAWQRALRRFLESLAKPCGLFAANDATAADVLVAARFEGLAVPGDLAVLGVDDFAPLCEASDPPLSSVAPDFRRGGRMAALLLLDAVRAGGTFPAARRRTFGPLRVVRRASTRLPAAPDRCVADALERIRREACSGLRAADVLKGFPCSRRMADLRFRKATGRSVLEEIHAVRLERAKRLLEETDMPLKILSDFCGFSNPNSLRKFFRAATGSTLSAWRAGHVR